MVIPLSEHGNRLSDHYHITVMRSCTLENLQPHFFNTTTAHFKKCCFDCHLFWNILRLRSWWIKYIDSIYTLCFHFILFHNYRNLVWHQSPFLSFAHLISYHFLKCWPYLTFPLIWIRGVCFRTTVSEYLLMVGSIQKISHFGAGHQLLS